MAVLVDSSVILDVMTEDPIWLSWSSKALARAADEGRLVINPIVFAEVSARYTRIEALEHALAPRLFDREPLPFEAAFLVGKVFLNDPRRAGTHPRALSDFFIGAHAAVAGHRFLTRDRQRLQTYFPKLSIISPNVQT